MDNHNPNGYNSNLEIPSSVHYGDIEYNVTKIGNSAFGYCASLTSITIPNSVTSIGYEVFSGCKSLTSITIPNNLSSIDYAALIGMETDISIKKI